MKNILLLVVIFMMYNLMRQMQKKFNLFQQVTAMAQQNKQKEALEYYVKAADANKNELTRPRYLMKAGKTALVLGNKADALKYFTDIKDNYETAPEAQTIDALIGLAQ